MAELLTDLGGELAAGGLSQSSRVVRLTGSPGPVFGRDAGVSPLGPGDVVCRAA